MDKEHLAPKIHLAPSLTRHSVELRDDGVGGMGHDGAEDAGDVSGDESDAQLLGLVALIAGLGHDVLVERLDGLLEAGELHHGVRDLPHPQRRQSLVEAPQAFALHDDGDGFAEGLGEARLGLDADFDGLEGRQADVGEELGRSRGDEIERSTVEIGVLLADHTAVHDLEQFVKAEFAQALHGVAHGRRGPAQRQRLHTALRDRHLEEGGKERRGGKGKKARVEGEKG